MACCVLLESYFSYFFLVFSLHFLNSSNVFLVPLWVAVILNSCFFLLFFLFVFYFPNFFYCFPIFLPETYLILVSLENRIFNSYLSRTCFVFYSYLSYLRHGPAFPLLERFSPKPLYPFKQRGVAMQDVACVHMSKVMKGFQSPVV